MEEDELSDFKDIYTSLILKEIELTKEIEEKIEEIFMNAKNKEDGEWDKEKIFFRIIIMEGDLDFSSLVKKLILKVNKKEDVYLVKKVLELVESRIKYLIEVRESIGRYLKVLEAIGEASIKMENKQMRENFWSSCVYMLKYYRAFPRVFELVVKANDEDIRNRFLRYLENNKDKIGPFVREIRKQNFVYGKKDFRKETLERISSITKDNDDLPLFEYQKEQENREKKGKRKNTL